MYKVRILELKKVGKTHNEIAKELGCAKSTVSFHCRNSGIKRDVRKLTDGEILEMKEIFKNKTTKETSEQFNVSASTVKKYCGAKTKKPKHTLEEKKRRNSEAVSRRRKKVKFMAVEYKGGKCENPKCGYDKYVGVLQFHHLDPSKKDFGIAANGNTMGWDKIKKELDKCIMVCSNCHGEIHGDILDPNDF
jgi:DNA-binding CsgD family transcriptional regulator